MSERLNHFQEKKIDVNQTEISRKIGEQALTQVLMYSGGWDSFLASKIYPDAHKLYVDLKTPYAEIEKNNLPDDVKVVELDLEQFVLPNGYHIPHRNGIFMMLGAAYGMTFENKDIEVILGAMEEDKTMSDKSPQYFEKMQEVINLFYADGTDQTEKFNVKLSNFHDYDKVSLWEAAGKPDMHNVISCFTGDNCGVCHACVRRQFMLNHIYGDNPQSDESIELDAKDLLEKYGKNGYGN